MLSRLLVGVLGLPLWAWCPPAAADTGPWSWPVAGPREVSRPFVPPASRYGTGHRGADLPSAAGAVVRSAGAGRVSYAGLLAGRGVVVVVHGALRTTYEPVAASVAVGDDVASGEPLGVLEAGHAGCPVAACLHWGLRRGDDYLDPVRLVERGPVRLLPVGPGAVAGGPVGGLVEARGGGAPEGPGRAAAEVGDAPAAEEAPREPAWALRAADAPLGAAAVAALVAGIGLLARPRPDPDDPPRTGSGGGAVSPDPEPLERPVAPVLELDAERLRRRTA